MSKPLFALASLVVVSSALGAVACGGSAKPADAPPPPATEEVADAGAGSTVPAATTTDVSAPSDAGTKLPSADGKKSEPGRSVEDIRAIVMSHRDEARKCYEDSLKSHPDLHGDVSIGWVINPKGEPTNVQVNGNGKTTLLDDNVQQCIVKVIQGLKFAPSQKGLETRTNYPFNFHPNKPM